MRRSGLALLVLAAAPMAVAPVAGVAAAAAGHRPVWHEAIEVPGTARLNQGGFARLEAVSCPSPGSCSAAGIYNDGVLGGQLFVVSERHGRWGQAEEIPGSGLLNQGAGSGEVGIAGLVCSSPGNCTATGDYAQRTGFPRPFVVSERNGQWGTAVEMPGTSALNNTQNAFNNVQALSCPSAGNCVAGGSYTDTVSTSPEHPFLADERGGAWQNARNVPGIAVLSPDGYGAVSAVSCTSAGNCVAAGSFSNAAGNSEPFTITETSGRWARARPVGIAALKLGGSFGAGIGSISCPSAGNCSAVGGYSKAADEGQVFFVDERHGVWGHATEIPGMARLNTGANASVSQVSCASAGNCSAGGRYALSEHGDYQAFVVNEQHGVWARAEEVPGTSALNTGLYGAVNTLSCWSAGNCSAGGTYAGRASPPNEAFVVVEHDGVWRKAIETARALNASGDAQVSAISCAPGGHCVAGGSYSDPELALQAFVVSRS